MQETLAEIGEEFGEAEVLSRTIERRYPGFDPSQATEKEKRRVVAYLQRKGFTLSVILAGLRIHSI